LPPKQQDKMPAMDQNISVDIFVDPRTGTKNHAKTDQC
jgi:hypothetical protein